MPWVGIQSTPNSHIEFEWHYKIFYEIFAKFSNFSGYDISREIFRFRRCLWRTGPWTETSVRGVFHSVHGTKQIQSMVAPWTENQKDHGLKIEGTMDSKSKGNEPKINDHVN